MIEKHLKSVTKFFNINQSIANLCFTKKRDFSIFQNIFLD